MSCSQAESPHAHTEALRLLDTSGLVVGSTLAGDVCDSEGKVLIPAGRVLEERHLELLTTRRWSGVYGGDDWPADAFAQDAEDDAWGLDAADPAAGPDDESDVAAEEDAQAPVASGGVSIDELQVGHRLPEALYTRDGVLLLAAGVRITRRFISKLRFHGVLESSHPGRCRVWGGVAAQALPADRA